MSDPAFDQIDHRLNTSADGRMRVFGIRRCGQHAVINWILRNCGRDTHVFLNSCTMGKSPVRTCGQSEINGKQSRKAHYLKAALETTLDKGAKPFVLISYEAGFPPSFFDRGDLTNGFTNGDFDAEVLVIRRFTNWLPSFIRLMRVIKSAKGPETLEISNGVVFDMMRYKDHLLSAIASPHQVVSFDDWYADESYRRTVLAALNLPVIDNSHGEVQIYGGGSSFSKHSVPAEDLDIHTRWKTLKDDGFALQMLTIAARDSQFMDALGKLYPDEPARIAALLAQS